MSFLLRALLLVGFLGVLPACRTFEGRYVKDPVPGQCVDGMPIVVERPRWLRVTYTNVFYGRETRNLPDLRLPAAGAPIPAPQTVTTTLTPDPNPELEIATSVVSVGEVFAVDFKRPFSGDIEYFMEFEPGRQYPKAIHTDVKDETLTDLAKSIEQVKSLQQALKDKEKLDAQSASTDVLARGRGRVRLYEALDRIEYYDLRSGKCVGWLQADRTRAHSGGTAPLVAAPK